MKKILSVVLAALLVVSLMGTTMVSAAGNDLNGAAKFLNQKFNLTDSTKDFKEVKSNVDNLGYKHVKLQQVVNGIPVYGGEYIVHFDKAGKVYATSGQADIRAKDYKAGKNIKASEAIGIAKEAVCFIAGEQIQADSFTADKYLYKTNGQYVETYIARISWLHEDTMGDWFVFVNANTGAVIDKYNNIQTTNVVGTGVGVLGDTKSINLNYTTYYYLQDYFHAAQIATYNAANKTRLPGTLMYATDTLWNSTTEAAAVDAHKYAADTYEYYYNKFGRNSINGAGMTIKSTVHYSRDYVNAFWNGSQMVYGDGDGVTAVALSASLDVVSHEMTHGVGSYEANLTYSYESGALSEALSDLFGCFVEYYAQPTKFDWLVGEDCWTPAVAGDALRSLDDPSAYGYPESMSEFLVTTSDNGGVHTNCTIPAHAVYHAAVTVGIANIEQVCYRAYANYMTSSCTFTQFRTAMLQSATDLYGSGSATYNALVSGFDSVGIY